MKSFLPQRGGVGLLDDMRREFDSMMTRFFGENAVADEETSRFVWAPRVDVSETDKALMVKADLPGVAPEDLEVSISNGALILRGEKREEKKEQKEDYKRSERFVGRFYRSIPLPEGCDAERIDAKTAKGVVTVTIPKKPAAQPKKIAVKAAD